MTGTILVLDDDQAILNLIEDVLSDAGHPITAFKSSVKAMDWIRDNPPARLVLVDLMMPEITGEGVIAQLHDDERYAHTPILVLTASFDGRQISDRIGATAYIRKPFDIDVLRDEVERWLFQSANS
jgi:CheY-like chemotaxis protein